MTGGSSQLRHLTDLVYRKTGVRATLAEDPLFCVVKGLGIVLEHLDMYKKSLLNKRW
jgi:rod shape-determining protein MreB